MSFWDLMSILILIISLGALMEHLTIQAFINSQC
ncbi:hypothetical protein GYH33_15655 [Shewanella sp. SE1]|nr:hypothetical protein [Shewanella sp. SE1]